MVVALWTTSSERKLKARAEGAILVLTGNGTLTYYVGITILNTGLRPLKVTMVGWRSGWIRRGPAALRYRHGVQITEAPIGKQVPFILQPSETGTVFVSLADMKLGQNTPAANEIFRRSIPLLGNAPLAVEVAISGRKMLNGRVRDDLAKFLRTNKHASLEEEDAVEAPGGG